MLKLKLILTILLISAISINFTFAQKKDKEKFSKTSEEIAEKIMERMKTNLELSDAQYNSIYPIVLTHAQEMKSMHEANNSYEKEDFRKLRKEKREQLQNEISIYLSDEQKQKMEEHKKDKMNKPDKWKNKKHKKHYKGYNKNKTPEEMSQKISERMKNKLNLTDVQQTSLQKIFLNHFTEIKTFKDSKDKYTKEECQKIRTEKKESLKNEVKLILTDEQFKTWEEMRQKHMNKKKHKKDKSKQKDDSENLLLPEDKNSNEQMTLKQNYPNPFNPTTNIQFSILEKSFVNLKIYDASGKELEELVNESLSAGSHSVNFDATNFPSGIYYYQIMVDDKAETRKMLLIK